MSLGLIALADGFAVGLPTFGAALGQGRATAAAMESIGRNPASADRIFTPMIIGLALMEALGLYGLVIAFMLAMAPKGTTKSATSSRTPTLLTFARFTGSVASDEHVPAAKRAVGM